MRGRMRWIGRCRDTDGRGGAEREVPKGGLEPPRAFAHCDLNAARIPISPLRRGGKATPLVSQASSTSLRRPLCFDQWHRDLTPPPIQPMKRA